MQQGERHERHERHGQRGRSGRGGTEWDLIEGTKKPAGKSRLYPTGVAVNQDI